MEKYEGYTSKELKEGLEIILDRLHKRDIEIRKYLLRITTGGWFNEDSKNLKTSSEEFLKRKGIINGKR